MIEYNIPLIHTVVHRYTGVQILSDRPKQAFNPDEQIPSDSRVDLQIRSTLGTTSEGRLLESHFQIDDIRLPTNEQFGYRVQFCLFGIFDVGIEETETSIKEFATYQLPNILAPIASEHHFRFTSILHPGAMLPRLQPHITSELIQSLIEESKFTFKILPETRIREQD